MTRKIGTVLLLLAVFAMPLMMGGVGCRAEVDDRGAELETGDRR